MRSLILRSVRPYFGFNSWTTRLSNCAKVLGASVFLLIPAAVSAEQGVSSDRIIFGQAAALDGPAAALGQDMRKGLLAAFTEVNKMGGIHGRMLQLISRDDGYEPNKSI